MEPITRMLLHFPEVQCKVVLIALSDFATACTCVRHVPSIIYLLNFSKLLHHIFSLSPSIPVHVCIVIYIAFHDIYIKCCDISQQPCSQPQHKCRLLFNTSLVVLHNYMVPFFASEHCNDELYICRTLFGILQVQYEFPT